MIRPSVPSRTCLAMGAMVSAAIVASLALPGCGNQRRSTRLTIGDFEAAHQKVAAALAQSDWLRSRTPDGPPWIIVINRVTNLTSDVLNEPEMWMVMARLRASLPIQQLSNRWNIKFHITPERFDALRSAGYEGELPVPETPTHVLAATFRSATRSWTATGKVTDRREEYYYLEFHATDLRTRETVWSDSFEFRRNAVGNVID